MTPDEYEFMDDKKRNMHLDAWVWEAIIWLCIPPAIFFFFIYKSS